jgi:pilus assembly protein FimV
MRAKPILSLTLLAAALGLPGIAGSVGLGRMTLQSSLGQPLSAQIELTSLTNEDLSSLTARVADSSLYRQNGLNYQGVLARARVAVERQPNGGAVLRITTPTGVSEPYLDLLVEVNWASGRVVRAYTFLLDPPGMPAAPAVEPVTPARVGAAPAAAPSGATGAPRTSTAAGGGAMAGGAAGNSYNVRRGDTLSRIAGEVKPPDVTLEQMLVALFNANPNAFDGANMNRLRAGAILNIPSAEQAGASAPNEATRTVRMQAADWRSYQDKVAGAAPPSEAAAGRVAGGKIGTTVEERVPAAQPGRDQLKVSPGKGPAAEDVVSRDKALREAQTRINELEKTLQDLQKALALKGGGQPSGAAVTPPAAPAAAPPPAPTPPAPAAKAPEPAKVEPPKAEPPPKVAMAPETKAPEPPKAAIPAPVETPKAAPAPKPPAPKVDAKAPAKSTSLFDDLFGSTPGWVIGGGAFAALAGIAALIAARRRRTVKFEDSIIGGTDIKTNTVFGSTGGGVVNTGENSLATDFSREGLGSIDTDEVDPIAEAEVYLAYGRDAQAEEILKDALKKDPQRQEIYLKLLEIHAQHNKPSAFETVAAELYSVSQGKGDAWQKAVTLGRQLDPNNPMFGEGGGAAAAAAAAAGAGIAAAAGAAAVDKARGGASPAVAKGLETDDALDFRFDEDVSISRTGNTTQQQIDAIDAAEREFEESAKHLGAAPSFDDKPKSAAPPPPSSADLDFRLDPHTAGSLDDAAAKLKKEEPVSPALAQPQAAIDLDKLDLAFSPENQPFEDPTPSTLDGQWHDAATKLDLAKAYQEMGDVEGAREILQEVLHEGDDTQKAEAQVLLAKLG